MTIAGQGGSDIIRSVLTNVVHFIKRKTSSTVTSTCDGRILKMHYQYSLWICMGIFCTVWYSWYHKESLVCVSHYNAEGQVRIDYLNICLSYNKYYDPIEEKTKNIMFYRWIPFSILLIGFAFYLPRKISKKFEDAKTAKLIEYAARRHSAMEYDREVVEYSVNFIVKNRKCHNGLFYKFFAVNVVALIIDITSMFALDFFLQGRFLSYGFTDFYNRDPQFYTDAMSRTFPPFTTCKISPHMRLIAKRTEEFGCHLTLMELYEKLFFFIWWWIVSVITITTIYIIFLALLFLLPYIRMSILKISKSESARINQVSIRDTISKVVLQCDIGDVYLLYRLKQHCSSAQFYEILSKLESRLEKLNNKSKMTNLDANKELYYRNNY